MLVRRGSFPYFDEPLPALSYTTKCTLSRCHVHGAARHEVAELIYTPADLIAKPQAWPVCSLYKELFSGFQALIIGDKLEMCLTKCKVDQVYLTVNTCKVLRETGRRRMCSYVALLAQTGRAIAQTSVSRDLLPLSGAGERGRLEQLGTAWHVQGPIL